MSRFEFARIDLANTSLLANMLFVVLNADPPTVHKPTIGEEVRVNHKCLRE